MALDVNKIIEESLKEANVSITESLEGGIEALKRSGKAAVDIFSGGSSQDEATAAKRFAERAIKKLGEGEPESIVAKKYLKQISQETDSATDSATEAKEKISGMGSKISDIVRENPGISAAAAAALAAGVGALVLRKKLKKANKSKE